MELFKNHIETHKYLLNEKYKEEIPLTAAYTDWLEYVFEPFLDNIERTKLMKYTNYSITKLYRFIMLEWHYDKKTINKYEKKIGLNDAVNKYCLKNKNYPRWRKLLIKIFK